MNQILCLQYLNVITPCVKIGTYIAKPAAALLEGPPGIGKTAISDALAVHIHVNMRTVILSTHEPPDVGGYAWPNIDRVNFLPAAWLKEAHEAALAGKRVVIFLDEFNWAVPAMQSAAMRLILEGLEAVGLTGHDPDLVRFVIAQNPPEFAEGAYQNIKPLCNRVTHYPVVDPGPDNYESFLSGVDSEMENLPAFDAEKWNECWAKNHGLLRAYNRARREGMMETPDKADGRKLMSYATRRSFLSMAMLHATCDAFGWEWALDIVAKGSIGEPQANEYMKWRRVQDIGDPMAILQNPKTAPYDAKRDDRMFAILSAVCSLAVSPRKSPKEYAQMWENGWEVIDVMKEKGLDKAICSIGVSTLIARTNRPKGHSLTPRVIRLTTELKPLIDLKLEV